MSSARPWMPLYISDLLGNTTHLSAAGTGAYLLLIMYYWANGSLPNDDRRLTRNSILIELNPAYAEITERCIRGDAPLFADLDTYDATADFAASYHHCLSAIRDRKPAGGPGWEPKEAAE
jgi:Protein of unknown function (DUF1376)